MSEWKISAFADEYADSAEEQLGALKRFGIRYIEVRHIGGKNISVLTPEEVFALKEMLDAFGIKVSAIGSPIGKIKLDGDIKGHLEMARRVFEYANILETKYVRIFSFYPPEGKSIADMEQEVFSLLASLLDLAKQYGITLCHENEAGIYGDTPARCLALLERFGGDVKCVLDMGNFVLEGIDPYKAYGMLREYIAYFHIKDAFYAGAVVPAGKGEAQIKEILSEHRQYAQDDFFVSLEPHLQTFSGLNALVGRSFTNPYRYADAKEAFADAVTKFMELIV